MNNPPAHLGRPGALSASVAREILCRSEVFPKKTGRVAPACSERQQCVSQILSAASPAQQQMCSSEYLTVPLGVSAKCFIRRKDHSKSSHHPDASGYPAWNTAATESVQADRLGNGSSHR